MFLCEDTTSAKYTHRSHIVQRVKIAWNSALIKLDRATAEETSSRERGVED